MHSITRRAVRAATGSLAALAVAAAFAPVAAAGLDTEGLEDGAPGAREVLLVANADGGTVSVVDAATLRVLREIDVLPDGPYASPAGGDPADAAVRQLVVEAAEGKDWAQDVDVSRDGSTLYVSRGHRGDVAAFDLASGKLAWKLRIPGFRSDHMAIAPDGAHLYVSAMTEDRVEVVDASRGAIVGSIGTGQWPHDIHLSEDGRRLYSGSIGNLMVPAPVREGFPTPAYQLTVADASTFEPLATYRLPAGIRPFVVTRDENRVYAQLTEYHGIVEFGLREGRVLRTLDLPVRPGVTSEDYDFKAPHNGLAISPDGSTLCAAARASDYVALASTRTMTATAHIDVGDAPGWAAVGPDGRHCFVANTRSDTVSVISFAKRAEVARIAVGDGPRVIQAARIPASVVCVRPDVPECAPRLRLTQACRGGGLRVRLVGDVDAVRSVVFRLGGRSAPDARAPFQRTFGRRSSRRWNGSRVDAHADVTRGPAARMARSATALRCS